VAAVQIQQQGEQAVQAVAVQGEQAVAAQQAPQTPAAVQVDNIKLAVLEK
jgi:hypothetical protein